MTMNYALKKYVTEIALKTTLHLPSRFALPPTTSRFALEQLCKLFPQVKNVKIQPHSLAGIHAEEIKTVNASKQIILHIHGGAFFLGSLNTHRAFMSEIASKTQMRVIQMNYPLAPEAPYPEAFEAVCDAYQQLLNEGNNPKDIILSGDSCGANFALALALKIKAEDPTQLPRALMLLSPFLDLTLTSESLRFNQKHDALLSIELLEMGMAYYLPDNIDRSLPQISPLFADFTGLPPTLVQVGSKEILLNDATRFEEKAKLSGVDVTYKLYTGMWHNFQMFSAWFDDAKQSIIDIADFAHQVNQP